MKIMKFSNILYITIIIIGCIYWFYSKDSNNIKSKPIQNVSVKMYSLNRCRYCVLAKSLLHKKGVQFDLIDVKNPIYRSQMISETGLRTVPQIFIDGHHIGGWSQLKELEDKNLLNNLLENKK